MYTIHLVRNPNPQDGYLIFVGDSLDDLIVITLHKTSLYSEALFYATWLYSKYSEETVDTPIASYIESPYETRYIASYSIDSFCAKKDSTVNFLQTVLEEGMKSLLTNPIDFVIVDLVEKYSLSEERKKLITKLLSV